ncbi:MAG: thioesterase [Chthonomonas sp.]
MIGAWSETPVRVRYGETDQMGHAYYANYLYWLEQARGAWCRDRGFTYRSLEEMGYFLPVVEVFLKYHGEIKYDDDIVVRVRMGEVRRASMRFEYEIVKPGHPKVLTEGHTWHVLMGTERKAVSVPQAVGEMLHRNPADCEPLA